MQALLQPSCCCSASARVVWQRSTVARVQCGCCVSAFCCCKGGGSCEGGSEGATKASAAMLRLRRRLRHYQAHPALSLVPPLPFLLRSFSNRPLSPSCLGYHCLATVPARQPTGTHHIEVLLLLSSQALARSCALLFMRLHVHRLFCFLRSRLSSFLALRS